MGSVKILPLNNRYVKDYLEFDPESVFSEIEKSCVTIKKTKPINSLLKRIYRLFLWQGQKDLNPRHAVLETAALPTELYPFE